MYCSKSNTITLGMSYTHQRYHTKIGMFASTLAFQHSTFINNVLFRLVQEMATRSELWHNHHQSRRTQFQKSGKQNN
jgi:hypothetical protein